MISLLDCSPHCLRLWARRALAAIAPRRFAPIPMARAAITRVVRVEMAPLQSLTTALILRIATALIVRIATALIMFAALAPATGRAATMFTQSPYRAKEFTLFHDGSRFHIIYMRHNYTVPDDSTEKDFGHAISDDLIHWTQLAPILPVRPNSWDNFHMWSPSMIQSNGVYYLYYTGVTRQPGLYTLYQRIGLAASTDLVHWTRFNAPVFGCTQVPWVYCDPSIALGSDFRDSFVMPDPAEPSSWLMYYGTRSNAIRDQMVMGVGRAASSPFYWADEKPLWNTDLFHSFSRKIESPAVFQHDSLWYMFYTTDSGHPINFETALDPLADSTGWSNQVHLSTEVQPMYTDGWFGPELLHFATHDYFAAASTVSYGVDIFEIVWTTPPHFSLTEPRALELDVPAPVRAPGIGLRYVRGEPAAQRWAFEVALDAPMRAHVALVDLSGRRIRVLADRPFASGRTALEWDGRDGDAQRVAAGVYFVQLTTERGRRVVRVPVLR